VPVRLCRAAKCANPATYRGRCASHAKERNRQTHPGKALYNTKRWKVLRRRVLFEQPLCECGQVATDVDHRLAIDDGGDPWARANVQGMCHQCHSIKTARELRAR
jgi:5-methylcytosine-specific restriction protein A